MIDAEIYVRITKNFHKDANAWLWHHASPNAFVCGINIEGFTLRIDNLRLFKAIVQAGNITIFDACGTHGNVLPLEHVDVFIDKYQPEDPTQGTRPEAVA